MKEKRVLEIEVLGRNSISAFFRIKEQSHRGEYFTPHGSTFKASNGIILASRLYPEFEKIKIKKQEVLVRGCDASRDDFVIEVPIDLMEKIEKAVKEYNIKCNIGDFKKEIRQAVRNIEFLVLNRKEGMKESLLKLNQANTLNEFLEEKVNLMSLILDSLPLGSDQCAFCSIFRKNGCGRCTFGREHGICSGFKDEGVEDLYSNIVSKVEELKDEIKKMYNPYVKY